MIPATWFNSLSPGNEQMLYFGSEGRTVEGTRNYPGIADPAVDAAIKAMLNAKTREEFVAAVRAEDRLLVAGFYIVPFYRCGRPMGGAVELYRPPGNAAASRLRGNHALAQSLSFTGEMPPERLNLARHCLSGKPAEKTALVVAGPQDASGGPTAHLKMPFCGSAKASATAGVERRAAVHPHGQLA